MEELSDMFGYSVYMIRKTLLSNNINIISKTRHANLKMDQNFFDNIDSEAKAYFLGFLITDGNIIQTKQGLYNISIEINKRDQQILEEFKECLNADSKISYRKRTTGEFVKICVGSRHMGETLIKLGVIPQKSKRITKLPLIREDLEKHFLRGLLDGDGGMYQHLDKHSLRKYWHITFCSYNLSICEQFEQRCNKLLNIEKNSAKILSDKNTHVYRVHYNKQNLVKELVIILYKDSIYRLDRKYNLFLEMTKNGEDIV